jgi:8-oxo-dGTP pyrophosphatase MutT (NUDIX family)
MRNTTLLFLIKKSGNTITDICLAMKKRGFGAGRYNGVGGKLDPGETIEQAVIRETDEEISVVVEQKDLIKIAELGFMFPHRPDFDQLVHVYMTEVWDGKPVESEEMTPKWFPISDIPYTTMWPDDILWLPQVVHGNKFVKASFTFGEGDTILDYSMNIS